MSSTTMIVVNLIYNSDSAGSLTMILKWDDNPRENIDQAMSVVKRLEAMVVTEDRPGKKQGWTLRSRMELVEQLFWRRSRRSGADGDQQSGNQQESRATTASDAGPGHKVNSNTMLEAVNEPGDNENEGAAEQDSIQEVAKSKASKVEVGIKLQ